MRSLLTLLLLSVLTVPVLIPPAMAEDAAKPKTAKPHTARKTWEQHFTTANVTHNGHLTLDEAKAGDAQVAKHFQDIDKDHKGYVTEKDIRTWRETRKAARRLTRQPDDKLRPRAAVQRASPDFRTTPIAHKQFVA